jgi:histidinol-phosphate/aromatic aminotransferase/cobyric acid decarboxylase-like protein
MHRFAGKKVALPIPTFSSYYEFLRPDSKLVWYHLEEKNNFSINLNDFSNFIRNNNVDTAILINPSNPVGTYSKKDEIVDFLRKSTDLDLIILDESFIHFAYEDNELSLINNSALINEFPNLVIIKSMSKDFGIAGIRAGYGIMHSRRVKELLYNGYLWNSSGLANYFFSLYSQVDFRKEYDVVRRKYIMETRNFIDQLATINSIKVFPTMANFALIKIPDEINSFDFTMDLLIDSGIYLRDCKDKVGLSERGGFIRVASRSYVENNVIFNSIRNYFL